MSEDATVTSKGQITIPKRVRDQLGLKTGSQVTFVVRGGEAVMVPKTDEPLEELRKLRNEIQFKKRELEEMIQESKEAWNRYQ